MNPRPLLKDIQVDPEGLIWVLVSVPGERWEEGIGHGRDLYGGTTARVLHPDLYWDTVVEVINPESAEVVARARLPQHIERFAGQGLAVSEEIDAGAEPRIVVWSLQIEGK
jgi:hypothetical protein